MSRSIGSASAGKLESTMTRWRRRSTMWSTCSMLTGHSRTQAPQVTQSQMLSSGTEVPAISGPSYVSSPSRAASAFGPSARR